MLVAFGPLSVQICSGIRPPHFTFLYGPGVEPCRRQRRLMDPQGLATFHNPFHNLSDRVPQRVFLECPQSILGIVFKGSLLHFGCIRSVLGEFLLHVGHSTVSFLPWFSAAYLHWFWLDVCTLSGLFVLLDVRWYVCRVARRASPEFRIAYLHHLGDLGPKIGPTRTRMGIPNHIFHIKLKQKNTVQEGVLNKHGFSVDF